MVWGERVAKHRDLIDKVFARAGFDGCLLEVAKQTINDGFNVHTVGHLVEQVQRLYFQGVVSVFQAVDHETLILERVLRINLDDARQSRYADILEIVRLRAQEPGYRLRSQRCQRLIRANHCNRLQALVDKSIANIDTHVIGSPEHIGQDLVHLIGALLVLCTQEGQDLKDLGLNPWRRHPMVIVILGQAMLGHLLQDNDERVYQVLEITGSHLDLIEIVIQTGGHDTGVTITQCSLHMLVEVLNSLHLVKADQDHHSFFPDHLLGVLHQCKHYILDSCNDMRMW